MANITNNSNNSSLPEMNMPKTLKIEVKRYHFGETCTLGKMYLNGRFHGYTLEDKYRALNGNCALKVQNKTAIDNGSYKAILSHSPRFKRILPELLNVPCFANIRIHGGNTADNSEGCILLGGNTDMVSKIWACKEKVDGLVAAMKGKECTIVIS